MAGSQGPREELSVGSLSNTGVLFCKLKDDLILKCGERTSNLVTAVKRQTAGRTGTGQGFTRQVSYLLETSWSQTLVFFSLLQRVGEHRCLPQAKAKGFDHLLLFLTTRNEERFFSIAFVCVKLAFLFRNLLEFCFGKFLPSLSLLHHREQDPLQPMRAAPLAPTCRCFTCSSSHLLWCRFHRPIRVLWPHCSWPTMGPTGSSGPGARTHRRGSRTVTAAVRGRPGSTSCASHDCAETRGPARTPASGAAARARRDGPARSLRGRP